MLKMLPEEDGRRGKFGRKHAELGSRSPPRVFTPIVFFKAFSTDMVGNAFVYALLGRCECVQSPRGEGPPPVHSWPLESVLEASEAVAEPVESVGGKSRDFSQPG